MSVAMVVAFYCLCSGGMLVINKVAVTMLGSPAFVTICQFAASAAVSACRSIAGEGLTRAPHVGGRRPSPARATSASRVDRASTAGRCRRPVSRLDCRRPVRVEQAEVRAAAGPRLRRSAARHRRPPGPPPAALPKLVAGRLRGVPASSSRALHRRRSAPPPLPPTRRLPPRPTPPSPHTRAAPRRPLFPAATLPCTCSPSPAAPTPTCACSPPPTSRRSSSSEPARRSSCPSSVRPCKGRVTAV